MLEILINPGEMGVAGITGPMGINGRHGERGLKGEEGIDEIASFFSKLSIN